MAPRTQTTRAAGAEQQTVTGSDVATIQAGAPPAFFNETEQSGTGVSNAQADKLIPMARVLQPLSPQVLQNNPDQIQGALAGDILIRNAPKQLIKGQQGFEFQSCFFYKDVVEWRPRLQGGGGGQGFVKRHPQEEAKDVPGAVEIPDPRDASKKIWAVGGPQGNWLVDTRYHVGYIIDPDAGPIPCYIPFSSTGHSVSKQWMFAMSLKKINGKQADSFAVIYKVRTRQRTRNNQTWFVFDIADAGPLGADQQPTTKWVPSKADYDRGRELYEAMVAGTMALGDIESGDGEHEAGNGGTQENAPM